MVDFNNAIVPITTLYFNDDFQLKQLPLMFQKLNKNL